MTLKAELTAKEKITAAYLYHVVGLKQSDIAVALSVANHGRVNEAIKAIEKVLGMSDGGYKEKQK